MNRLFGRIVWAKHRHDILGSVNREARYASKSFQYCNYLLHTVASSKIDSGVFRVTRHSNILRTITIPKYHSINISSATNDSVEAVERKDKQEWGHGEALTDPTQHITLL